MEVNLQVLQGGRLFRLEHGGSGHADGGEAHVPEALGVRFALHQNGVASLADGLQPPFTVEVDLAAGAVLPPEPFLCEALSEGGFCSIFQKVRDTEVRGAAALFGGADPAYLSQEVHREPLLEAVLLQGVRSWAVTFFFRCLWLLPILCGTVSFEDGLVGIPGTHTVELRPEGYEVSAVILCEAVPFACLEIHREAVVPVLVEGAEADQVIPGNFLLFDHCGVKNRMRIRTIS